MLEGMFWRIVLLVAVMCATAELSFAERKVALIIGNSSYQHSQPLKNPSNDARAVGALFEPLGYEVHLHLDTDRRSIAQAVGDFHQISSGADSAIFYYAGHGVSVDGRNYLIPVDSDIQRVADVKLGLAIDAELAIEQALADAKVKLVFLDACRDNPFVEQIKRSLGATRSAAVSSGLSEMKSGAGTLIAFSTAPGQVALDGSGNNSPFAEALVRHLSEPGLEIRLAMTKVRADVEAYTDGKQTPWESTNLTGFYFMSPPIPISTPPAEVKETNSDERTASDAEIEFWRSVRESKSADQIKLYIKRFPNGYFVSLAQEMLSSIENTKVETSSSPPPAAPQSELPVESNSVEADAAPAKLASVEPPKSLPEKKKTTEKPRKPERKPPASAEPKPKKEKTQADKPTAPPAKDEGKAANNNVDKSAFLRSRVINNWGSWRVPSGAKVLRSNSQRASIMYQGRKYNCYADRNFMTCLVQ